MDVRTRRPIDLYATAGGSVLLVLVVLLLPEATPLRLLLGLPFVLFLPGYALVAALFPARHHEGEGGRGLEPLEGVALSFGLSIAVVPLLGLLLDATPWGIRLVPVLLALLAFTLAATGVALARRARLPPLARPEFALRADRAAFSALPRADKLLVVATALALLVAGASVAYVLTAPRPGERFTEFYVLGPGGRAEGYPTTLAPGAEGRVLLGVANHEGETVTYDVRPRLVEVEVTTNETGARLVRELASAPLPALSWTLPHGATREEAWTFTVPDAAPRKLVLDLHRPGEDAPYRSLHLWVNAGAAA